jgi:hypothetical protein
MNLGSAVSDSKSQTVMKALAAFGSIAESTTTRECGSMFELGIA